MTGSRKRLLLFCLERVKMKLIECLKELDENLNIFVICINANCEAFVRVSKGEFDLDDAEEATFFRTYASNVLKSSRAVKLLKDIEIISAFREEEIKAPDNVVVITVSCKDNYTSIKKELTEILN